MAKTIIAALVFIGHSKQSAIPIAMAYIFLNEPAISVPIKSLVSFKRNVSLQKTFFTNFVASAFLLEIFIAVNPPLTISIAIDGPEILVMNEREWAGIYCLKMSVVIFSVFSSSPLEISTQIVFGEIFFTAVSKSVIAVIFFDKLMPGKYFLFS